MPALYSASEMVAAWSMPGPAPLASVPEREPVWKRRPVRPASQSISADWPRLWARLGAALGLIGCAVVGLLEGELAKLGGQCLVGSAYFPHRRVPVAYETQTCGNQSDHGRSISDCNTRWTSFDFSVVMPVARRIKNVLTYYMACLRMCMHMHVQMHVHVCLTTYLLLTWCVRRQKI